MVGSAHPTVATVAGLKLVSSLQDISSKPELTKSHVGFAVSASVPTAYLLVSHGSRDPRPGQGMERLALFVRSQEVGLGNPSPNQRPRPALDQLSPSQGTLPAEFHRGRSQGTLPAGLSEPLVGTACLEAEALPLHRQIVDFSRRAQAAGVQRVKIIPLFLLAGVHVMDDIPAEIDLARQALGGMCLEVAPHLGSHPELRELLHAKLSATSSEAFILLAHGSRRPRGTDAIATLARSLGGSAAFWAVPPSLEAQVIHHIQSGAQRLSILPYFLFAGTITDAVTHLTEELAERFSSVNFHLLPPLGPSPDLARLVVDLALDQLPPKGQQAAMPMQRVAFRHTIRSSSMVS